VFEYSIRDFFECQNVNFDGRSLGLPVGFQASAFECSIRDFFEAQKIDVGFSFFGVKKVWVVGVF
jgi:hypothetical protein